MSQTTLLNTILVDFGVEHSSALCAGERRFFPVDGGCGLPISENRQQKRG